MKKLLFIQRILAALIDLISVYVPFLILVNVMFADSSALTNLLPAVIFVVYNSVAVNSFGGQTLGKHFAKLTVKKSSLNLMTESVREAVKILYFLPFVGGVFILVSCFIYVRKGQFLHDVIGCSEVVVHG
ncbi:hypothetical protein Hs30E_01120 [Lactococcus hodotermopsidis]|uniref:RDD domain-containing protein n=1 Tax=Pseudolactococcus hodotermopsidis TaxID=2709157 RepID=A0A6A0BAS4_9LACT|nr:RDD family protein [Lactococcus hodotermopsidis]GFH41561.1 hypothetical protein Hs30E_01120 [Lactococcus hodotermopsidis]